jgi:hypothetical protein
VDERGVSNSWVWLRPRVPIGREKRTRNRGSLEHRAEIAFARQSRLRMKAMRKELGKYWGSYWVYIDENEENTT